MRLVIYTPAYLKRWLITPQHISAFSASYF
uniref:Uncharacterized protein n=1 Tax=Anguilla anguilla TaxID=7936 RepID=A0A0E9T144_ANGAN